MVPAVAVAAASRLRRHTGNGCYQDGYGNWSAPQKYPYGEMQVTDGSDSLSSELDLAAEVIQLSEQAPDRLGAIAAREVIGAKIFVFDPILEHVPSGIEHRGGDRENGLFDAAASF